MNHCNHLTKNNQPCKVKVSEKSFVCNGMKYCHIHSKTISKQPQNVQNDSEILLNAKSPPINYTLNKNSDSCYVCLEETETKLSCGHFIHTNCMLNIFQSSIKKNYKVFETSSLNLLQNEKNFIITNCLYCKQISVIKNVEIPENFFLNNNNKYDFKKSNNFLGHTFLKINNETLSYYFNEIFLKYDTYETKQELENSSTTSQLEEEFLVELKQLIFDNFSNIIFDNYIQQSFTKNNQQQNIKNIKNIKSKYKKINKNKIIKKINNTMDQTLYSKLLFNKIKNNGRMTDKIEVFFRVLENVINNFIKVENVQDDVITLLNVF